MSSCEYTTFRVYARACYSACVRYTSDENNYLYGYIYKCMFVYATANMCILFVGKGED